MYKRQSRKRPLCPMQSAFRPDTFYILYLSSTPRIWREVIKRQTAYLLHGSLTLAPSLWTDRELRKYHYRLYLLLPPSGTARIYRISFIARSPKWGPQKFERLFGERRSSEAIKLSCLHGSDNCEACFDEVMAHLRSRLSTQVMCLMNGYSVVIF